MGLGTLLGMAVGALGGAMAGGEIATNMKLQPLRDAQDGLKGALQQLEAAVAAEQAASAERLRQAECRASTRFERRRASARRAYDELLGRLAADRREVTALDAVRIRAILSDAESAVRRAVTEHTERLHSRGHLERRSGRRRLQEAQDAAETWQQQADETARACLLSDDATSDFFDVVLAAPNGVALVKAHLTEVIEASHRLRLTAVEGNRRMVACILEARTETVASLKRARAVELRRAQEALVPHKSEVTAARDLTKQELAKAGAAG
jgi:hypothetical protein